MGSKITADGDCNHEFKRRLLHGNKGKTNLDSAFKGRDVALLTTTHQVKPMVFPVVMNGCESKKIVWWLDDKKGWAPKSWYFRTMVLEKTLEDSWTARRSNQSILKETNPEYSLKGQMVNLNLQSLGHLIRANLLEKNSMPGKNEGKSRMGCQRIGWRDGITFLTGMSLSKLRDSGEQKSLVWYSRQIAKSWKWPSNWTTRKTWPSTGVEFVFCTVLTVSILNVHWKDWSWSWNSNTFTPNVKSRLIGKDPDSGKDWRQEKKRTTEDELVGSHHRLNGHEFE